MFVDERRGPVYVYENVWLKMMSVYENVLLLMMSVARITTLLLKYQLMINCIWARLNWLCSGNQTTHVIVCFFITRWKFAPEKWIFFVHQYLSFLSRGEISRSWHDFAWAALVWKFGREIWGGQVGMVPIAQSGLTMWCEEVLVVLAVGCGSLITIYH